MVRVTGSEDRTHDICLKFVSCTHYPGEQGVYVFENYIVMIDHRRRDTTRFIVRDSPVRIKDAEAHDATDGA